METISDRRPQMNKIQRINIPPATFLSKPTLPSETLYQAARAPEKVVVREGGGRTAHSRVAFLSL